MIEIGESPDDVIEYLTNFGGDGDLHQFAIDLQKHKLGEDISTTRAKVVDDTKQPAVSNTITKPQIVLDEAAAQRREIEAREKRRREEEAIAAQKRIEEEMAEQQRRRKEEEEAEAKKKKQLELEKKKAANASTAPQKKNEGSLKPIKSNMKSPPTKSAVSKKQTPKSHTKKLQSKPQKGKPVNKICGCYGNKHKPLTNCLHCGRISCDVEGYDYCHFCGYLIQDFSSATEISDGENNIDSAIRHKERLLEFDRTSASRTHVHDDQEDYFVTSNNMWATSKEQDDAREQEENRRQKLHTRQKQTLDIKF